MPESFPPFPLGTTAVSLPDGEYKHPFLEAFGRPARAMSCECERDRDTNLMQALHLVGGKYVHQKLQNESGRAAKLAASNKSDEAIIEELFLATLSRFPTDQEKQVVRKGFVKSNSARRTAVEDVLWSLINHNEFLFQH